MFTQLVLEVLLKYQISCRKVHETLSQHVLLKGVQLINTLHGETKFESGLHMHHVAF